MPVVHVRALDPGVAGDGLGGVAAAVARSTPCDVGDVWCTLQPLAAQTIGADAVAAGGGIAYVDVWLRPRPDDPDAGSRALEAACRAVAELLATPVEDVWGALHPVEPGRVFAGGRLLT